MRILSALRFSYLLVLFILFQNTVFSMPAIEFEDPTPANGSDITSYPVYVNTSIGANLINFTHKWNKDTHVFYDSSLVAMFNFDNVSTLGENSNYAVNMVQGENATASNQAFLGPGGKYGGSAFFDGNNDYFSTPDSQAYNFSGSNATIELWFKSNGQREQGIIGKQDLNWVGLMFNFADDNTVHFFLGDDGATRPWDWIQGAYGTAGSIKITDTEWHHVALTRLIDGSTYRYFLYIDGVFDTSYDTMSEITYPSANLYVGKFPIGTLYMNGSVDELRIWKRYFSASEIAQHYRSNLNKQDIDQWIFFEENNGPIFGSVNIQDCAADADGINCTESRTINGRYNITMCARIDSEGNYLLESDILANVDPCINISSANVSIDMHGHNMTANVTNVLIFVADVSNITIKNVTIKNGFFYNPEMYSIMSERTQNLVIINNTFSSPSSNGGALLDEDSNEMIIANNVFNLTGNLGLSEHTIGLVSEFTGKNITIENNSFYDAFDPIFISNRSQILIMRNTFVNGPDYGIKLTACQNIDIIENSFTDIVSGCILITNDNIIATSNTTIAGNTIRESITADGITIGAFANLSIENNTVENTGNPTGTGLFIITDFINGTSLTISNNFLSGDYPFINDNNDPSMLADAKFINNTFNITSDDSISLLSMRNSLFENNTIRAVPSSYFGASYSPITYAGFNYSEVWYITLPGTMENITSNNQKVNLAELNYSIFLGTIPAAGINYNSTVYIDSEIRTHCGGPITCACIISFGGECVYAKPDAILYQDPSSDYDFSPLVSSFNSTFNVSEEGTYPPSVNIMDMPAQFLINNSCNSTFRNNAFLNVSITNEQVGCENIWEWSNPNASITWKTDSTNTFSSLVEGLNLFLQKNLAGVDSESAPGFNNSANITMNLSGLSFSNPIILKNGIVCGASCINYTSLDAEIAMFEVNSFSNYSVGNSSFITVTIDNPVGTTYSSQTVQLSYTVSGSGISSCWYILNSASPVQLPSCANTTFTATTGQNELTVFANNSLGTTANASVSFSVNIQNRDGTSLKELYLTEQYDCTARSITITVTKDSGTPINLVKIKLSKITTYGYESVGYEFTDANGIALFQNILPGKYLLFASKEKYSSADFEIITESCESWGCKADSDCQQTEKCHSDVCIEVECNQGFIINHSCIDDYACQSDSECPENTACISNVCESIPCNCGYISNHACIKYACCYDSDCTQGICSDHLCTAINQNQSQQIIPELQAEQKKCSFLSLDFGSFFGLCWHVWIMAFALLPPLATVFFWFLYKRTKF